MKSAKFKVGDKVKCIDSSGFIESAIKNGDVATVIYSEVGGITIDKLKNWIIRDNKFELVERGNE